MPIASEGARDGAGVGAGAGVGGGNEDGEHGGSERMMESVNRNGNGECVSVVNVCVSGEGGVIDVSDIRGDVHTDGLVA